MLVIGLDQSWLKKDLNIMNIIMILILFYGNVFNYYIHVVIIIMQTHLILPATDWLACSNTQIIDQ